MSNTTQPITAEQEEKKKKRIYFNSSESQTKVEEYLREYNEDKTPKFKIRLSRVPLLLRIYRLCIIQHNKYNSRNVKVITRKRKNDDGELIEERTIAFITKEKSLATHFQCHPKTIQRQLRILTGEAAKRADVTPPVLLEVLEKSCYGLTLLLNPDLLVATGSSDLEEK